MYKQIHIENLFYKILYSFIETYAYFLTDENPYWKVPFVTPAYIY